MSKPVPPAWNVIGKHGVFPDASHDEIARFNFLTNMNIHLSHDVLPGVKTAYENRVVPAFEKKPVTHPKPVKKFAKR